MKFVAARQTLGTFPVRGQSQDAGGDFILALRTAAVTLELKKPAKQTKIVSVYIARTAVT